MIQPQHLAAHAAHLTDRMRHKDPGDPALQDLLHLRLALLPEGAVPHGQHLVQDQDVRFHQAGDGERQPALHAAGQLLEAPLLEFLKLRKGDYIIIFPVHELPGVTEKRPPEIGVLPDGQVPVETGGELQQRCDLSTDIHPPLCGHHDPGYRFQQRGFPRSVRPDDPQHVAGLQRKGDIPVRPELLHVVISRETAYHIFLQTDIFKVARHVADRDLLRADCVCHSLSSKILSIFLPAFISLNTTFTTWHLCYNGYCFPDILSAP